MNNMGARKRLVALAAVLLLICRVTDAQKRPPPRKLSPAYSQPPPPPYLQPPPPPSQALDIKSELRGLSNDVRDLQALLTAGQKSGGIQLDQVLPVLSRISPHAAAYLARSTTTKATIFLPSAAALDAYVSSIPNLGSMDLPSQLALYSRTLTTIAFHTSPSKIYKAADLLSAAQKAGATGLALTTLVPSANLQALVQGSSVVLKDSKGSSATLVETDYTTVGSRLVIHIVSKVLAAPDNAQMPLAGPNAQIGSYSSLYAWLADPSNCDATLWHVLTSVLPDEFFALLKDPSLRATLFVPDAGALLYSPAVQAALASPPAVAALQLSVIMRAHLLPNRAMAHGDIQMIHYGGVETSAVGTPLVFTHGDAGFDTGHPYSITFVNFKEVKYWDLTAGQSYIHVIASPLDVDVPEILNALQPSGLKRIDLHADLQALGVATFDLLYRLTAAQAAGQPLTLQQVLPVLSRISPHAAAYLARSTTTKATLFLPSAQALVEYITYLGGSSSALLWASNEELLPYYAKALTALAYHMVPGTKVYKAADLVKAGAKQGGAALATLLPGAKLTATSSSTPSGSLVLGDSAGQSAAFVQTDLVVGTRLVIHVIDTVMVPPDGARMPLAGPNAQIGSYASLYAWLADPSNCDATLWHVFESVLPDTFLATMQDTKLAATLFLPGNDSLLYSNAVKTALSSSPDGAGRILQYVLQNHILGEAMSKSAIQGIHFGITKTSAAGSTLTFTHGDVFKPKPYSITFVNMDKINFWDLTAGKSYIHVLDRPLDVDLSKMATA